MDLKKFVIGASVAGALVVGLFLKNKFQQQMFVPLQKDIVLKILKKSRMKNFFYLKQITILAGQIIQKMQKVDRDLIQKNVVQAKFKQAMSNNLKKICGDFEISVDQFNDNIEFYLNEKDRDIIHYVTEAEKTYEDSLQGKLPQPKVQIPQFLTKQKLIEIHRKLTQKKFLINLQNFRALRGVREDQLKDPQVMKLIQHPQKQQQKILEEEGLGINDDPPTPVFLQATMRYGRDPELKKGFAANQTRYREIYRKYHEQLKNQNITDEQLNDIEEEFIYA